MVAEMARRFILERQRTAIEAAKKKGVYKGLSLPSRSRKCARCKVMGRGRRRSRRPWACPV
jgi:DNA invertase Pin-like site-specific DNA recombinase